MPKLSHRVCSVYEGFSQTAWEGERMEKWCSNNATDYSGFAQQFNSSSRKLENNVPNWQIHFSTYHFSSLSPHPPFLDVKIAGKYCTVQRSSDDSD